jgi:hypothetical protein
MWSAPAGKKRLNLSNPDYSHKQISQLFQDTQTLVKIYFKYD